MKQIDELTQLLEKARVAPPMLAKWKSLTVELASIPSAVVAFSGGVDSSFLAFITSKILGNRMTSVTILSALEPASARSEAASFSALHGIQHIFLSYDPLQDPVFQANPPDRCYHCKKSILRMIWDYAREHGFTTVLEGQNADDLHDYRPGRKAVSETGTLSPLAHNNLTKAEIRQLSKALGLSTWDQPGSPCLATRIPYGTAVTRDQLERISRSEEYLHKKGFRIVRVRSHGDLARIEVEPDKIQSLLEMREEINLIFSRMGFLYVTVDLKGFRSGSMNEGLTL